MAYRNTFPSWFNNGTRDGVDTRKKGKTSRLGAQNQFNGGQNAAVVDATRPWGDLALEMSGNYRHVEQPIPRPHMSEMERDVKLYLDMSDEPAKYGDDIFGWEQLHEKVHSHPSVVAYWADRDAKKNSVLLVEKRRLQSAYALVIRETARIAMRRWVLADIKRVVTRNRNAATLIQKIVRGYQARCRNPHLDCCMCLSHTMCPLKTSKGYMCRDCGNDGPYTDIMKKDPWNWDRAEFVDEAPPQRSYEEWVQHADDMYEAWISKYIETIR